MSTLVNERYELDDVLGSGGMGRVYRARDTRLSRTVAIKLLHNGGPSEDVSRLRMKSEAQLAGALHHPGIAQIFDYDEDRSSDDRNPFIVMQYVSGVSLAEVIRERGVISPSEVMSIVAQVADALDSAHRAGIIHRDLKPANIMLTPDSRTVLVDFGIALSETSEPLTATGTILGTADYVSPEQASGRTATGRSDLYSLGVVAHHCLSGQSPFRRNSHIATALAHLHDDVPPLGEEVPPDVRALVEALTAKNPADRPASADVVADMASATGPLSPVDIPTTLTIPAAHAPVVKVAEPEGPATAVAPVTPEAPDRSRRRALLLGAAGVVVAALALMGVQAVGADDTAVPGVVGMDAADAARTLRDADFTVEKRSVDVADADPNQVTKQSPAKGSDAPTNKVVTISVASGKVRVAADDVIGMSYSKASAAMERLGLVVKRDTVAQSAGVGTVVGVDRSGRLSSGSTITLAVAVAPTVAAPVAPQSGVVGGDSGGGDGKVKGGGGKGKSKAG
ncbi:protein kinase [Aeromicrobium sp.]|uniref:protein kinase domain-containing protein n=1 Tax=Aeromicrobium sp. TaxID=1871063 RepID=UPI0019A1908F|nr:protein kinase [Aeromicrobium sp.]MBC7631066.1 protein kinase [Aeromicrobium sp.]